MNAWHEEDALGRAYDGRLMRRFLRYVRPHAAWAGLAFLLLAIRIAFDLATVPILQRTIDGPIAEGDLARLLPWTGLFAAAIAGMALFEYLELVVTNRTGQSILYDLRRELYGHLQRLPLSFFDRNPVGRLMVRVTNDVENLNELFTAGLVAFFSDILLIAGVLAVMLAMSWKMALVALIPAPLTLAAVLVFRRFARDQYRELRLRIARLNSALNENVAGVRTIQMFNREASVHAKFREMNEGVRAAATRAMTTYSVFFPVIDLLSALSGALLLAYGGVAILKGELSFGTFLAFWYLAQKFFHPVRDLSEKYNILQAAMASSERIFQLLDTPVDIAAPASPRRPEPRGEIAFEQVRFSYDGVTPVLQDLTFRVAPGERVAVVGITGAGKTTLANLLLRLYEVSSGRVLVDGVDVREWDPRVLRRRFGLVLQDVFLFAGSIEDNLTLGDGSIPRERVAAAAATTGLDRLAARLPRGLATEVRERGLALSAGERQLLSFARALAADPGILILDEATSHVDSESEAKIQEALPRLLRGRTSLVIAHRLSTVRTADRILVVHQGRIAEQGTHAELLARGGLYDKLVRLQFEMPGPGGESRIRAGGSAETA